MPIVPGPTVPFPARGALANRDRKCWANDFIVATAARDLDLFVAHDMAAPKPAWLQDHRDINADDHRPDGLKALGNSMLVTPNLDALAASGMTFTRCYTMGSLVGAVCTPSRTMMLTGRSWLRILCLAGCYARAADAAKPNIIYILADGLGYGDVQCFNPERGRIKMPSIDRLAEDGRKFTDAHAGASVCTPTRYGILTGRYAWRTRLQNGVLSNYDKPLIAPDRLTLPGLLKQQGYHTACIGKWHLGFTVEEAAEGSNREQNRKDEGRFAGVPLGSLTTNGPGTRGFDLFFGFHHARMMKSLFENERVTQLIEPVDMLPTLTRRAVGYVAERAKTGNPFFLYFALNSPHTPIVPSKEWQGKSGVGDYGDFVMETDWAVGEVLAAVDQAGIAANTMVVFTSDNGCSPAAGVERLEKQGHFPSAQFRGYKSDIWDGGHRIPFLVRWPGYVKPGSTSDQLICLTDFMATCADLLGVKLPHNAGEDSVSILPALQGQPRQPLHEAVVHHSIQGNFSIRQGPWKLELCAGSGGWGKPSDAQAIKEGLPSVQLYNLAADIGEQGNLESGNPDRVNQMTALLEHYVTHGRSTPGLKQNNDWSVQIRKPTSEFPETNQK